MEIGPALQQLVRRWRYGTWPVRLSVVAGLALAAWGARGLWSGQLPAAWQAPIEWGLLALAGSSTILVVLLLFREIQGPPDEAPKLNNPSAVKGTAPFAEDDGPLFAKLGRSNEIRSLRDWVSDDRVPLVVLVGESGVGKTSLLRAGLRHALPDAVVATYREATPQLDLAALEKDLEALSVEAAPRRLIVLDQFEQLDALAHSEIYSHLKGIAEAEPPFDTTWVIAFRKEHLFVWMKFQHENFSQTAQQRLRHQHLSRLPLDVAHKTAALLLEATGVRCEDALLQECLRASDEEGVAASDLGITVLALAERASRIGPTRMLRREDFGGAVERSGLLRSYLDMLLTRRLGLQEDQRKGLLRALLELTNEDGLTRVAEGKTVDLLAVHAPQIPRKQFDGVLIHLAAPSSRILETVGEGDTKYRLVHDRLVAPIRELSRPYLQERDVLRLRLDRSFRRWQEDGRKSRDLLSLQELFQLRRLESDLPWQSSSARRIFVGRSRRKATTTALVAGVLTVGLGVVARQIGPYLEKERARTELSAYQLQPDLLERLPRLEALTLPGTVRRLNWMPAGAAEGLRRLVINRAGLTTLRGLPEGLTTLHAAGNRLESLEGLPEGLMTLDVSHNSLESLEGLPEGLTTLDVSDNSLEGLEGLPTGLTTLGVADTGLERLEGLPKGLTTLDVRGNSLEGLEGLPEGLTTLDVSYNSVKSLENLPEGLITLDISHNRLEGLEGLPEGLTTLDVCGNSLESLEGLPEGLTTLDVSDNWLKRLEGLPEGLTVLDVSDNSLESLEGLPEGLTTLDVSDNSLKSLEGLPEGLTTLDISHNSLLSLEGLPEGLITTLDVRGNRLLNLEGLPEGLTTLDVRGNRFLNLDGLPKGLTTLDVSVTGLNAIFGNHEKLTALDGLPEGLTRLDLAGNRLLSPEGLPQGLTALDVRDSGLESLHGLPEGLTTLDVGYNRVESLEGLPEGLTTLNISHNRVESLEGLPEGLTTLDVSSNPLRSLAGLPSSVVTLVLCGQRGDMSLDEIPEGSKLQAVVFRSPCVTSLSGLPDSVTKLSYDW